MLCEDICNSFKICYYRLENRVVLAVEPINNNKSNFKYVWPCRLDTEPAGLSTHIALDPTLLLRRWITPTRWRWISFLIAGLNVSALSSSWRVRFTNTGDCPPPGTVYRLFIRQPRNSSENGVICIAESICNRVIDVSCRSTIVVQQYCYIVVSSLAHLQSLQLGYSYMYQMKK